LAYRLRALLVRGFESAGEAVSPQLTSLVESKPLRPVSHPGGKECIHEVRELDEEGRAGADASAHCESKAERRGQPSLLPLLPVLSPLVIAAW